MGIRQFKGAGSAAVPAVNLTKKDPKLAAVISKMTSSLHGQTRDAQGNRRTQVASTFAFRSVLQRRAKRNSDAAQILRLLPDIELSAQILTSSILSPKDMTTMELLYLGPKNLLTAPLSAALLGRLKEHFEETYKIKPLLTEMVREPLFEKGSYPIAVIPENAIDDFINGDKAVSLESMSDFVTADGKVRMMGLLGPHKVEKERQGRVGVATEQHYMNVARNQADKIDRRVHYQDPDITEYREFVAEEYLHVVDNPTVLKIPKLNARTKSSAVKKQYKTNNLNVAAENLYDAPEMSEMVKLGKKLSTENLEAGLVSDHTVEQAIYRTRQYASEPIAVLKKSGELKRRSVGGPLIMKLPSEAVIPVHVPGNLAQHIGYFIILDEEGNPVEVPDGEEGYQGLQSSNSTAANSLASNLIRKVETNLTTGGGSFDPNSAAHMEFATRVYADMVERDLIARVKNGVYASNASLAKNEEVYRIMLSRVLAKKYTQVLYVPAEFMTYIAFKYSDDGIGRSLLDDTTMINTLRSVMLFSGVMAAVKNSIGRTKVSAKLDEHDPNPMKNLERSMDEIVRSRMLGMPTGVSNLSDIFEFIQRAGYEWEIEGHPGLPDLKFEFMQMQSQHAAPDTELQDMLRKSSIMAFGLSPETVDNAYNTEFATTAIANNVLLAKRVYLHQDRFTPQLSDHLRKVAANTEDLVQDLKTILEEQFDGIKLELDDSGDTAAEDLDAGIKKKIIVNRALQEFLSTFYVELPRPTSITLDNQMSDLQTYSDALDKALDAYVSSSFFTSATGGDVSNEADTIKNLIKAHYIRKWLADKGILQELGDLTGLDEEGQPILNISKDMTDHVKALVRSGVMALATLSATVQAGNKDMAKLGVEESPAPSFGGGGDSGGGGGFGDLGGDMDFGLGGDLGGDPLAGLDDVPADDAEGKDKNPDDDLTIPTGEEAKANETPDSAPGTDAAI